MYRIAQEALENIVLHANAGNMELKLVHRKGNVILEISDDGQGFNYPSVNNHGRMGIKGMEERATEAGGTFRINTKPDNGTTIRVEFKD
jgi:signal transduction histidine kinase